MILLQALNSLLGLLQGRKCLFESYFTCLGQFLSLILLNIGLNFLIVSLRLFLLGVRRFSLHFLDEFICLASLLLDLDHLDLKFLLESQDLALRLI